MQPSERNLELPVKTKRYRLTPFQIYTDNTHIVWDQFLLFRIEIPCIQNSTSLSLRMRKLLFYKIYFLSGYIRFLRLDIYFAPCVGISHNLCRIHQF